MLRPLLFLLHSLYASAAAFLLQPCRILDGSCWVPAAPPVVFAAFCEFSLHSPYVSAVASCIIFVAFLPAVLRFCCASCRFCCVPAVFPVYTHLLLHSCFSPSGFLMISCCVRADPPVVVAFLLRSLYASAAAFLLQPCRALDDFLLGFCCASCRFCCVAAAALLSSCCGPCAYLL